MNETPPPALKQWQPLIIVKAQEHRLDPCLLGALCWQESSGESSAWRPEPHFTWFFSLTIGPLHDSRLTTEQNRQKAFVVLGAEEFDFQSASHGLCQVMGSTFRELGFTGPKIEAYDPETNIEYGCRYLKLCLKRGLGLMDRALLRYNGGAGHGYPQEVYEKADILAREI